MKALIRLRGSLIRAFTVRIFQSHVLAWCCPLTCVSYFPGSQTCHDYLISGPNGVKDSQLSASSVFSQLPDNHGADRGRLFADATSYSNGTYQRGAWSAGTNNQMQYIQVRNTPMYVRTHVHIHTTLKLSG